MLGGLPRVRIFSLLPGQDNDRRGRRRRADRCYRRSLVSAPGLDVRTVRRLLPEGVAAIAVQRGDGLLVYVASDIPDALAERAFAQTLEAAVAP